MSEDRHKNLLHIPREAARFLMATSAAAVLAGTAAQADVTISKKATQNMSCQAGVCSPTAPKAVLNATDLANMLAGGDVKITTGSGATNIVVKDSVGWTSASGASLTLGRAMPASTRLKSSSSSLPCAR